MTAQSLAEAYADAAHRLVGSLDVVGNLVPLLADCAALTGGEAAGLLARGSNGGLELVTATSHRAAELELYELQHESGPCVEAVRTGQVVSARSDVEAEHRSDLQLEMAAAGFRTITAFPVLWHHDPIGAVNVFHLDAVDLTPELRRTGEAFATMAALVLAQPSAVSTEQIETRVLEILQSRVVVEQAKGVIAYQENVDMETAFRHLLRMAAEQGSSVLDVAIVAAGTFVSPASAQAADSCQGGTSSGHCVSASNIRTASTVVESVPLSNTSPYSATLSCSFTQTITRTLDTSASVSAGVSAQILGSVSASASVTVSQSVSQSASAASSAGGSITLAPGQSVTCQRVYSYVTTNVREYDYTGSGSTTTANYTATVPSSLGVNIA